MVDWSYWNPFKRWARPRTEVVRILEQVLDGTLDCREWDNFINIPMKADPELEALRRACEQIAPEESIGPKGNMIFSEKGRQELQRLLASIKK